MYLFVICPSIVLWLICCMSVRIWLQDELILVVLGVVEAKNRLDQFAEPLLTEEVCKCSTSECYYC